MRGELPGQTISTGGKLDLGFDDEALLFDKEYRCPVCKKPFTMKRVRSDEAVSDGRDIDLRPRYKNIDVLKYRVIECPACGYAELDKFFSDVNSNEAAMLRENSTKTDADLYFTGGIRDYERAYEAYKSAIRCNLIRGAKNSRRGLTALYTAWLVRSWREAIENKGASVDESEPMGLPEEEKFLKYALSNFKEAELKESSPLSEIGEAALAYLIAALLYDQGEYSEARKYLIKVLNMKHVDRDLRIKAEDLQDIIGGSDD